MRQAVDARTGTEWVYQSNEWDQTTRRTAVSVYFLARLPTAATRLLTRERTRVAGSTPGFGRTQAPLDWTRTERLIRGLPQNSWFSFSELVGCVKTTWDTHSVFEESCWQTETPGKLLQEDLWRNKATISEPHFYVVLTGQYWFCKARWGGSISNIQSSKFVLFSLHFAAKATTTCEQPCQLCKPQNWTCQKLQRHALAILKTKITCLLLKTACFPVR